MKVLILAPYPLHAAPSQRFRFEHFLKSMEENGIEWDFQSYLSPKAWEQLYDQKKVAAKISGLLNGIFRRLSILPRIGKYQYILLHREGAPFGPPVYEWLLTKVFKKKVIYDFDDAIWLADQGGENTIWNWLKWRSKVKLICKWSWRVSAGNKFLSDYAGQFCDQVMVLPTVVNTDIHKPKNPKSQISNPKINLGWTGSHSTLFYLDRLIPVLQDLENEIEFEFLLIANQDPKLPIKNYRFVEWKKETEIEDLSQIDIGVMPLEDNEWAKGKCGFKLIQYLALGIPAICSDVGVNREIVRNGETGFVATSDEEWKSHLVNLMHDQSLRTTLGEAGRNHIISHYSVKSQEQQFLDLFKN